MARCKHCGKDYECHGVLCAVCGLVVYDEMMLVFNDPPVDGTLARVKYNRTLKAALRYLQEVHPQEAML